MKTRNQQAITQTQSTSGDQRYEYSTPEVAAWNYRNNPAVRELLDHLADELALEYCKLMDESEGKKGSIK